jgi:hypothetical protein
MTALHRQQRFRPASIFDRACAVLCLFLLLFAVGHTVYGHADALQPAPSLSAGVSVGHQAAAALPDTADNCVLCAAMSTAVPLQVFTASVPQAAEPRQPGAVETAGPVTGWHASLSCRPPPAA